MKIAFRRAKLSKQNLARLVKVNEIIEQYGAMGYTLTLRQLYYRLVSEDIINNTTKDYASLIHLLTEGRMSGLVDWDGIEDRVRTPNRPYFNDSVEHAIEDAVSTFRLDRQLGQKNYVELWVEKDAISNILKVKTHYYGIYLMVNRGFSSTTAMYNSACRIQAAIDNGQVPHILYLGDHDPSGLCMALRDIPERLQDNFGVDVSVKHIGITTAQIKQYNPPPNPAKLTDSRAQWYIKNYGRTSWEVDALEPKILHELIESELSGLIDKTLFTDVIEKEVVCKVEIKDMPKFKAEVIPLKESLEQQEVEINELGTNLIAARAEVATLTATNSDLTKEVDRYVDKLAVAVLDKDRTSKKLAVADGEIESLNADIAREKATLLDIKREIIKLDPSPTEGEGYSTYVARMIKLVETLKDRV